MGRYVHKEVLVSSMRLYEVVFVTRPDLTDDAHKRVANRIIELVTEDQGKVLHVDDWGTRKTAYPVQKFNKGHFVQVTIAGFPGVIGKIERILRILDEVMKFFSLKAADVVDPAQLEADTHWSESRRDDSDPKRRGDRGGDRRRRRDNDDRGSRDGGRRFDDDDDDDNDDD